MTTKEIIKAACWKLCERGAYQIVQLVVQIVLARILLPSDFGEMAILLVFIALSNALVQTGISSAIVQKDECSQSDYGTATILSLVFALGLYALLFAVAPLIASFYAHDGLVTTLRVLALILPLNALNSIQVGKATRELDIKPVFKSTTTACVASGVVSIAMALDGWGIWSLIAQQIVLRVVTTMTMWLWQGRWIPSPIFSIEAAREIWRFGWRLAASSVIYNLYQNCLDLITGKAFSMTLLGFFSQGRKLPYIAVNCLDGAIQTIVFSALSKVQNNKVEFMNLMRNAMKTMVAFVAPLMLFMAVAAEPIVLVAFGEKWLDSVPFFQLFCIGYSLVSVSSANQQAFNAIGRSDIFLKIEIAKTSLGLMTLTAAILISGDIYVVAVCAAAVTIISTAINAYPSKKIFNYSYGRQIQDLLPSLVSTSLAVAVLILTKLPMEAVCENSLVELLFLALTMVFLYSVFSILCKNKPVTSLYDRARKLILKTSESK